MHQSAGSTAASWLRYARHRSRGTARPRRRATRTTTRGRACGAAPMEACLCPSTAAPAPVDLHARAVSVPPPKYQVNLDLPPRERYALRFACSALTVAQKVEAHHQSLPTGIRQDEGVHC